MTDSRWWQPAVNQAPHPFPSDTALLAASRKHAVPSPAHLSSEGAQRRAIHGDPIVAGIPPTTARSHWPTSGMGSCMRRRSSTSTSPSFACSRLRIVCRSTVNRPLLLFFPHMCIKPRKLNVSGFPAPRLLRSNGPNSRRRVLSGCSSRCDLYTRHGPLWPQFLAYELGTDLGRRRPSLSASWTVAANLRRFAGVSVAGARNRNPEP
jgi:hypothetical protein